jgi:hypothetical protein
LFDCFADEVRRAQVDETLARLNIELGRIEIAADCVARAVETLENGDEEALLAEALTTKGLILHKLGRSSEAKGALEGAYRVAERCGDSEGAGRALLIVVEEMCERLGADERKALGAQIEKLLTHTQQSVTHQRLRRCLDLIETLRSNEDISVKR